MDIPKTSEVFGAVKVKDGLFMGDKYSCQNLEFLVTNKVTHIINCSSKELNNQWSALGIIYLSLPWQETDNAVLFDSLDRILSFIDKSSYRQESCLVHSVKGQSRSSCVIASYFMLKYHWNLYKTLEFLNSRRSDLEIRTNYFEQLKKLESQIQSKFDKSLSGNWEHTLLGDKEELVIRNTFLNSKNQQIDQMYLNKE